MDKMTNNQRYWLKQAQYSENMREHYEQYGNMRAAEWWQSQIEACWARIHRRVPAEKITLPRLLTGWQKVKRWLRALYQ